MVNLMMQRVFLWACCLFLFSACTSSFSGVFPYDMAPDVSFENKPSAMRILSSKGLKLTNLKGNSVTELSGISWDADEKILYAVSDEGILYHLNLSIERGVISHVSVISEYKLRDKKGKKLKKKWRDSEGLSSQYHNNSKAGDTELIVAFEGKPRVARYTPKGKYIGEIKLPAKLWNKKAYRAKNKALESVAFHPTEGIITAAEFPLKKSPMGTQTVFTSLGKEWSFPAANAKNSAITGLEVLPNGNIVVLERAWAGIQNPVVITLSELAFDTTHAGTSHLKKGIASLSSAEGWLLDNFEGLAHYQGNQFFMISDDNDKDFQTTVLVLFEIKN